MFEEIRWNCDFLVICQKAVGHKTFQHTYTVCVYANTHTRTHTHTHTCAENPILRHFHQTQNRNNSALHSESPRTVTARAMKAPLAKEHSHRNRQNKMQQTPHTHKHTKLGQEFCVPLSVLASLLLLLSLPGLDRPVTVAVGWWG